MKHNLLTMTTAAGLLLAATGSNGFAAKDRTLSKRGAVIERVKEKLGVTEEQAAKIKTELVAEKESITDVMYRLHAARTELREVTRKSGATENEIRGAAAKVAAVEADAAVLRAKLHKKIDPLLTSEQREKLQKMRGKASEVVDRLMDRIGEKPGKQ